MSVFEDILQASSSKELFGEDDKKARQVYLRFAREVHPDMVVPSRRPLANQAFQRLQELWESWQRKDPRSSSEKSSTIKTRRREYTLQSMIPVRSDDVVKTFSVSHDDGHEEKWLTTSVSAKDNDLIANAVFSLRTLQEKVPQEYRAFFPRMDEKLTLAQPDGGHASYVSTSLKGFYSLQEVIDAYPGGIDGRDVAWMFRRMLVAVGNAHDAGLIHGACVPASFYILPSQHGLVLENWHYSPGEHKKIAAIPGKYKSYYSDNVLSTKTVTAEDDIAMTARTALALMGNNGTRAMRAFFKGCMISGVPSASVLLAEFTELLTRLYGPPSFHPFEMPKK